MVFKKPEDQLQVYKHMTGESAPEGETPGFFSRLIFVTVVTAIIGTGVSFLGGPHEILEEVKDFLHIH